MTKTVGAFEAKTHFSALLEEIEQGGAEITITKHGRPVAKLVPIGERPPISPAQAIEGLRQLRRRLVLNADWKALRDAGRR